MGKKTPPFPTCPEMTTAKFWGQIRSDLRKRWMFFPERKKALNRARVGNRTNKLTGRMAMHFKCSECGEAFIQKQVDVDHINDAGSLKCYDDLPSFVERLFCSADELAILCKTCHKSKTHKK